MNHTSFKMVLVMVMVFIYRIFYIHIQMRFTLLQYKGEIGHQHIYRLYDQDETIVLVKPCNFSAIQRKCAVKTK